MKSRTTLGKSFEINKDSSVYGSFAEIGAGQETVNYFFKAGLASQTIAKSMSAYDMTFSDEIYGKQNRYVCKDRLVTMLNHEYKLLEKRLKKTKGKKSKFFAFATTAATSLNKKKALSLNANHAWMGLRFQTKPLAPFNEIIFHVNCLDKTRLQQHEALGILGVNLVHSCFHYCKDPKKFIPSLIENLSPSRIEINGINCSGPSLKNFPNILINKMLLEERLSKICFFSPSMQNSFIGDIIFKKPIVFIYGNKKFIQQVQKQPQLKKIAAQALFVCAMSETELNQSPSILMKQIKNICKKSFYLLLTQKPSLESLKNLIRLYTDKSLYFIISEEHFKTKLFKSPKNQSLLKYLIFLFDNNTTVIVSPKSKQFSIKDFHLRKKENQKIKDRLVTKKQILTL